MLVVPSLLCTLLFGATAIPGGPGSSTRLQAAIDACPATGCDIELPDADYPMDQQLWIAGKDDVRIRSTGTTPARLRWVDSLLVPDSTGTAILFQMRPPSGGGRPDLPAGWLRWPTAYKGGVGTLGDTTETMSSCGHQHNGMILVKSSRNIRLEKLVLDGIRPAFFANKNVWNSMYDIVHGSVGVGLFQSRGVEIAESELRNFWAAVYMNDRNPDCASWTGGSQAKPWTGCGTMGNHLVEGNRIHGNKFGIYSESAWDLGSVFRDNLAWDNRARSAAESVLPKAAASSSDNQNITGGFVLVKDVVFPAHVSTRNTIADTSLSRPYGWTYHRAAANALWSDDLVEMRAGMTLPLEPMQSSLHLFTSARHPHVWSTAVLGATSGRFSWSGTLYFDSSFHWAARRPVPRDTLDGRLAGGRYTSIPGDTVDTLIEGEATRAARARWVTIFYDTLVVDSTCGSGCWFDFETQVTLPTSQGNQVWNAQVRGGDSVLVRLKIPDGRIVDRKVWLTNVWDSTATFRLQSEKDTATAWTRNLVLSANAGLRAVDPSHPDFLTLDTTLRGSRDLLRKLGSTRARVGAPGNEGRLFQEPVRLRTRGHGRLDKANHELVLPVKISGRLDGVSRLVVRRIWIAARPIDPVKVDQMTTDMSERRVLPSSLPEILPIDTVIRIPFSDAGTDSLFQVDLWLAAVAGTDTLDATPMAWSIASVMGPSQTTTGILPTNRPATWKRQGQFLCLLDGRSRTTVEFLDARGSRRELAVRKSSVGEVVDLSSLPRGVWLPHLPGSRPVVLTGL